MDDKRYKEINKRANRLLYLRQQLDIAIDNTIRENVLREKGEFDTKDFKDGLDYIIEDAVIALEQNR